MIELKLEEDSTIRLAMDLNGDVDSPAEMRFSIISEGIRYSFNGNHIGNNDYEIRFPAMEGKITEGKYQGEVEILIGNQHFVPLTETVSFTKEIKPIVTISESKQSDKKDVFVRITNMKQLTGKPIKDVEQLVTTFLENNNLNTEAVLNGLDAFISKEDTMITEGYHSSYHKNLSEDEVVGVLKIVGKYGNSLNETKDWRHIKNMSPETKKIMTELIDKKLK